MTHSTVHCNNCVVSRCNFGFTVCFEVIKFNIFTNNWWFVVPCSLWQLFNDTILKVSHHTLLPTTIYNLKTTQPCRWATASWATASWATASWATAAPPMACTRSCQLNHGCTAHGERSLMPAEPWLHGPWRALAQASSYMTDSVVKLRPNQGVKNIGRWTRFCYPLKKKNGMNSLEGISWKK